MSEKRFRFSGDSGNKRKAVRFRRDGRGSRDARNPPTITKTDRAEGEGSYLLQAIEPFPKDPSDPNHGLLRAGVDTKPTLVAYGWETAANAGWTPTMVARFEPTLAPTRQRWHARSTDP